MPWKTSSAALQRQQFVTLARQHTKPFPELCRDFQISRSNGYKWLKRCAEEGWGAVEDRSRRPRQPAQKQAECWQKRALALRRRHPAWGAKKIRALLGEKASQGGLPCVRTLERWFQQHGLLRTWRRTRRGPAVPHPGLTVAQRAQQVWTVDFKGWYRTGDGQRQEPLTVRDLHTRYLLTITLLANQSEAKVRPVFRRLFRAHGLPEAIRVDNGAPFGGKGALGLTRLSVWWLRLGIRVEFTRRARPGDNAGHEQMHGLFAREVAAQASANRRSEQRRVERWRREYNELRPHEALQQRPPAAAGYRPSPCRYPTPLPEPVYDTSWSVRRVRPHGDIKWQGRLRFIGRAFVGERVGLQPTGPGQWAVYWGSHLVGALHAADRASMRPAHWRRVPQPLR